MQMESINECFLLEKEVRGVVQKGMRGNVGAVEYLEEVGFQRVGGVAVVLAVRKPRRECVGCCHREIPEYVKVACEALFLTSLAFRMLLDTFRSVFKLLAAIAFTARKKCREAVISNMSCFSR